MSGAGNDQSGKIDCTISKPCAIQSMQRIRARSSMPGVGEAARPNTISGSMRGSAKPVRDTLERLASQVLDRPVVDIAPDWRIDIVFGPDGPVGEPDLAADRMLSACFSRCTDGRRDPVGSLKIKIGTGSGERGDLAAGPQNRESLSHDILKIHWQ